MLSVISWHKIGDHLTYCWIFFQHSFYYLVGDHWRCYLWFICIWLVITLLFTFFIMTTSILILHWVVINAHVISESVINKHAVTDQPTYVFIYSFIYLFIENCREMLTKSFLPWNNWCWHTETSQLPWIACAISTVRVKIFKRYGTKQRKCSSHSTLLLLKNLKEKLRVSTLILWRRLSQTFRVLTWSFKIFNWYRKRIMTSVLLHSTSHFHLRN